MENQNQNENQDTRKKLETTIKNLILIAKIEERKFHFYRNMFCVLLLISPVFLFTPKLFAICYFSTISYILLYDYKYIEPLEKEKKEARQKNEEKDNE